MSFISKLNIKNIRGLRQSYELAPLTYIWGPNKSNKSTIADAIRIAILGNFPKPGVPKTNEGVMYLASDSTMEAGVKFADGRTIHRRFWKAGDSTKSEVDPKGYAADAQLAMCLDTSLYFGKTDSERVQQVISMSEAKDAAKLVPGIIAKLKILKAKDHDERAEKALGELINMIPVHKASMTVQQWLAEILKYARETYTQLNASLKNLDGTSKILTEANAIDVLSEFTTIEQLKGELERLGERRHSLNISAGVLKHMAKTWDENQRRRVKLTAERAELAKTEMPAETATELRSKLESENKALEGTFSEIAELESTSSSMENEFEDLDSKRIALDNTVGQHALVVQGTTIQIAECDRIIAHFQESVECPTCHAKTPGWREPAIQEQRTKKQGLEEQKAKAKAAMDEASARHQDARTACQTNKQVSKVVNQKLTALRLANAARQNQINSIRAQLDEAGKYGMRTLAVDEQIIALGVEKPRPDDRENPEVAEIKRRTFEVEAKIEVMIGQERERIRIKQVEEASASIRFKTELIRQIGEVVKAEQASIVEGAFRPVLQVANELAANILPTPLAYKDGMVGRFDNKSASGFVPVGAFSGSEERIAFAAITAGLAATGDDKIAIIDEIGTFDLNMQALLYKNAEEAIHKGLLDQLIIIGTVRPVLAPTFVGMAKVIDTHES